MPSHCLELYLAGAKTELDNWALMINKVIITWLERTATVNDIMQSVELHTNYINLYVRLCVTFLSIYSRLGKKKVFTGLHMVL